MQSDFLRREIEAAHKTDTKRRLIMFSIILCLLGLFVAGAVLYHKVVSVDKGRENVQGTDTRPDTKTFEGDNTASAKSTQPESPKNTSSSLSMPYSQTVDKSEEEVNARLCQDIISSARALNDHNNKMYLDAWNDWLETFRYRFDTAEAIESKQFYLGHFKKLFTDLVSSTDPSMKRVCKSETSLADILIQPDYSQWQ